MNFIQRLKLAFDILFKIDVPVYLEHLKRKKRPIKIICVSGEAQNGKDTFAGLFQESMKQRHPNKRVLITHYADLLKYIAKAMFGWNGVKDEYGRTLLQRLGTDNIRKKCPNFWVVQVLWNLDLLSNEWDYVVIPDARFPNEIQSCRDAGYETIHVRVSRPGFDNGLTEEQRQHPSETALNGYPVDIAVVNDGDIKDLQKKVNYIVDSIVNN